MAGNISDEDLYRHASRVHGQVVVITGAASGIGRAAALIFAKRGAKVVIGDINTKASEELVNTIRINGGTAIWKTCNVLDYDDQRSLFEFALEEFGSVDVVIANAGIGESERLFGNEVKLDEQGIPVKPILKTVQIDYISVIYTVQLAFHYFGKTGSDKSLRSLVLTASILSFTMLSMAPLYSSSKHAVLSLAQSLRHEFASSGFRIATVHPWFIDTPIVPERMRKLLKGIPLAPVERAAGAIVLAVTDTTPETNGAAYTIPDECEVFRIPPREINEEIYSLLSSRAKRVERPFQNVSNYYVLARYYAGAYITEGVIYATLGCSIWLLSSRLLPYVSKLSS